jgi:hypothetical protein
MQLYVHLSDLDRDVVTLKPPFEQVDAWGKTNTLAYVAGRVARLDRLRLVEVVEIAERHPAAAQDVPLPAGAGGYYLPVSDPALEEMVALDSELRARDEALHESKRAALEVLTGIPDDVRRAYGEAAGRMAELARGFNEGGDGFVPMPSWNSIDADGLLARHGIDPELLTAAASLLSADEHDPRRWDFRERFERLRGEDGERAQPAI